MESVRGVTVRPGACGEDRTVTRSAFSPLLRRFLVAAWTWLLIGIGIGLFALAARSGLAPVGFYSAKLAHVHVLTVGFLLQWVSAVAYWLYPGKRDAFDARAAETAWWGYNLGTLLRLAGESGGGAGTAFAGGLLQAAGAAVFVLGVAFRRLLLSPVIGGHARRGTLA